MAWWQTARSAITRIAGKDLPRRICYVHVPKCGGTSVAIALERAAGIRFWAGESRHAKLDMRAARIVGDSIGVRGEDFASRLASYYMKQDDVRIVSGHFCFLETMFEEFGDEWDFVTIVRDPVPRWISNFFFRTHDTGVVNRITVPLSEYLDAAPSEKMSGLFSRYLRGVAWTEPDGGAQDTDAVMANLEKFAIVARSVAEFGEQFEARYGVKLEIPHVNRSPVGRDDPSRNITDEQRRRIAELCESDLQIYERIGEMLDARKSGRS